MNFNWRHKKSWDAIGLILTIAWFIFISVQTGGDLNHRLANYVFVVPILLWAAIIFIKSRLPEE